MTNKKPYNLTQLSPMQAFRRGIIHRDQGGHMFRFSHLIKHHKIGQSVLDFGSGIDAILGEVLYRNRHKCSKYLAMDIRSLNKARDKFAKVDWIKFEEQDLVNLIITKKDTFDIVCSFEVIEHIGKHNAHKFLNNVKQFMHKDSIFMMSTPVFDERVGAADNHIINGEVGEFKFDEMKAILE